MPVEKAFAIKAEPAAIWRALTGELEFADGAAYDLLRAVPNELLSLWVDIQGGIRAILTYRLIPREDHTEVIATMEPQGLRYAIFRLLTLGRADTNYELLLVEGLANLKRAVETGRGDAAGAGDT
ncbi:MAG: hypothetical protein A2148_00755 [Chloroflexi bacterium RBG_16_68_14]|nr:MAG: hypothetical protein A2148_00755 [Chloroflexi bacterium RBG_16_68_14]